MIEKDQLNQILQFVSKKWSELGKDANNKAFESIPSEFWMNSIGGPAGKGKWITTVMYTENDTDAEQFKEVLLRWQAKSVQKKSTTDLIKIKKLDE